MTSEVVSGNTKTPPTEFRERLACARALKAPGELDQAFGVAVGLKPASVSDLKGREDAPAAGHVLSIARYLDVDPGWLAFGEATAAPGPAGWREWIDLLRVNTGPTPAALRAAADQRVRRVRQKARADNGQGKGKDVKRRPANDR